MSEPFFDSLSLVALRFVTQSQRPEQPEQRPYQLLVVPAAVRRAPGPEAASLLRLPLDQLFQHPICRHDEARCVQAGLMLWLDALEPAHRIAQEIGSPGGSFWHAIMHRREGDFDNSKYWYARCAEHPVLASLEPAGRGGALVDLVAHAVEAPEDDPLYQRAVRFQHDEWRALMHHCARAAVTPR